MIEKLRIKRDVDLTILEKYGFQKRRCWSYIREIHGEEIYEVWITERNRNIQIRTFGEVLIASGIQCLIYKLITDGLAEYVNIEGA